MWRLSNPVWPKNSCGLALVVFQEPAKPLTTLQWACTYCVLAERRKGLCRKFCL